MDGTANAVLHLDVQLGDDVVHEGSVLLEVLLGGGVDDVSDGEPLHSLVLRTESAAVDADDVLDVTSVVFISAVVSSLDGHVVNIY